jgi:hypothetical protein
VESQQSLKKDREKPQTKESCSEDAQDAIMRYVGAGQLTESGFDLNRNVPLALPVLGLVHTMWLE